MQDNTPIGITDFRNQHQPFGIKQGDRFGHIYVIGKTGTGKSTLLLSMVIDDIQKGRGVAIIDPHGDLSNTILDYIPKERMQDVIYFNATDQEYPIAFNPLCNSTKEDRHLVASELVGAFKKLWSESWGPRLEYILRFSILTLLEYSQATLLDIQPLLTDYAFRNRVLHYVSNTHITTFWRQEFDKFPPALKAEAIAPILNKTGLFISSTILRNIVGQRESSMDIAEIINTKKILIGNLSKGEIGEEASALLGSMLVSAIQFTALRRATQSEAARTPFYLYIDEMHSFVSLSLADILAEARKYKLSLFLAHQYLDQVHEKIRSAIFGNVGTIISFRVGAEDAVSLAREFYPVFTDIDLIHLPKYACYIKMMIDGATSKPFSARTQALSQPRQLHKEVIIEHSRKRYARSRAEVENSIATEHKKMSSSADSSRTLFA